MVDVVVIGGGIYGECVARELSEHKVCVVEKAVDAFQGNSVLNSGVLHSGIYYTPGSLKAELCREGNELLRQYCKGNNLYLNDCGKLIIPQNEGELNKMSSLLERARLNGVSAYKINSKQAEGIESDACLPVGEAIFVEKAAVGSPLEVLKHLHAENEGKVQYLYNSTVTSIEEGKIKLSCGKSIEAKWIVNCAGQGALELAKICEVGANLEQFSVFANYSYFEVERQPRVLIYPIPVLMTLGVHLTQTTGDLLKIGPSAELGVGNARETINNISQIGKIMLSTREKSLMIREFYENTMTRGLPRLARIYKPAKYFGKPSFTKTLSRYPLYCTDKKAVEQDFKIIQNNNQIHLLNFQSPGWTSALAAAKRIRKIIKC